MVIIRTTFGEIKLELDAEKRRLAVRQAENTVEQARAALDEARLRLERRRNLANRETISEEVLDNAQLNVDRARNLPDGSGCPAAEPARARSF